MRVPDLVEQHLGIGQLLRSRAETTASRPPGPGRDFRSGAGGRRRRSRQSPSEGRGARRRTRGRRAPHSTTAVSRLPGSCIGGSPAPPVWPRVRARGARPRRAGRAARGQQLVAVALVPPGRRRCRPERSTEPPPSSRRRSWHSRDRGRRRCARPRQRRARLPRSTCESIGALTPERSARSRSERSLGLASARTRAPTWEMSDLSVAILAVRYHVQLFGYGCRPRGATGLMTPTTRRSSAGGRADWARSPVAVAGRRPRPSPAAAPANREAEAWPRQPPAARARRLSLRPRTGSWPLP